MTAPQLDIAVRRKENRRNATPDSDDLQDAIVPYIPLLRRYAQGLTRDPEAADDLVQDALLRAMEKRHLWKPGSNLRAWLYRILHNTFINNQRRAKIRRTEPIEDHEPSAGRAAHQDNEMLLKTLETGLHDLPPAHREVVMLIGVEGLSYHEAAVIMDCPVGTIRSRLSRAREALKHYIDGTTATPH